jgi:hypothetical protein
MVPASLPPRPAGFGASDARSIMAYMRIPVHFCTLLVVLALIPAAAHADIAPLPKPSDAGSGPVGGQGAVVAPLPKPAEKPAVVSKSLEPATAEAPAPTQTVSDPPATRTQVTPITTVLVSSAGGREAPVAPLISAASRNYPTSMVSRIVRLVPTPLAISGIDESLPAKDAWPAWVLAVFSLLVSAEAFLLVRLARARRYRRDSEEPELLPDL